MKQIIPFKKDLLFKTNVNEITSISLEHTLSIKKEDRISGEFYISGDYKITASSINRENFSFKIPFDIELDNKYDLDTISIDIDNFYYEVVNNESLQVNIDLYLEGVEKKKEEVKEMDSTPNATEAELVDINFPEINQLSSDDTLIQKNSESREEKEEIETSHPDSFAFSSNVTRPTIDSIILENKEDSKESQLQNNFNIFENVDNADSYVTYHVYIVHEEDTIDSIIKKYNVDKEQISLYNNIEQIKPGTKLIIPNSNE